MKISRIFLTEVAFFVILVGITLVILKNADCIIALVLFPRPSLAPNAVPLIM
jgi:hypothetical protein